MTSLFKQQTSDAIHELDEKLSQRFIALDPSGYFLIRIDSVADELIIEHFTNDVNEEGLATNPETGEPIGCRGGESRKPSHVYRARSAKELGIQLTEGVGPFPLSRLDHALYLGRELQRAEACLISGEPYIQD